MTCGRVGQLPADTHTVRADMPQHVTALPPLPLPPELAREPPLLAPPQELLATVDCRAAVAADKPARRC